MTHSDAGYHHFGVCTERRVPSDFCVTLPAPYDQASPLTIMSWSCRGRLYSPTSEICSRILDFITLVCHYISSNSIDVLWLTDAHFLKSEMDPYVPHIARLLPFCKVIKFPTTEHTTRSRNHSNDRMGGSLVIITQRWASFLSDTYSDPIGLGLITAITLTVKKHHFRIINAYFFPPRDLTEASLKDIDQAIAANHAITQLLPLIQAHLQQVPKAFSIPLSNSITNWLCAIRPPPTSSSEKESSSCSSQEDVARTMLNFSRANKPTK